MPRNKGIIVMTALLVAFALPAAATAQQDGESQYQQNVEVSATEAEITVERAIEDRSAQVVNSLDTTEGLLSVEASAATGASSAESTVKVRLQQLVEYVDEDEDGQYDADEAVKSSWLLSEGSEAQIDGPENGTVQWQALNESDIESADGVDGKHVRGQAIFTTQDPVQNLNDLLEGAGNRTFTLDLYMFEAPTTYNGSEILPTQVHVDASVDNYPWAGEGTRLALVTTTEAESLAQEEEMIHGVETVQTFEGLGVSLSYTWEETATVDDAEEAAHSVVLEDEVEEDAPEGTSVERSLATSYAHGEAIQHAQLMGATFHLEEDGFIGSASQEDIPSVGLIGLLAAAGVSLALARRFA
ncbi:MAG: hypothetical protein R3185_04445 [Candidatus Thermoplasmatota archaeon]|nr:hypothetical protein [Candidatus Thermoplasmatota archaeon]